MAEAYIVKTHQAEIRKSRQYRPLVIWFIGVRLCDLVIITKMKETSQTD